jgi:hypothetical protein
MKSVSQAALVRPTSEELAVDIAAIRERFICSKLHVRAGDLLGIRTGHGAVTLAHAARSLIWTPAQCSRFIESALLDFPVGPLLATTFHGRPSIIDGAQRCLAIVAYLEDRYRLTGLQELPSLNGLVYSDLPKNARNKLDDFSFDITVLDTQDEALFASAVSRLIQGGVPLTDAQTRNVLYAGPFQALVSACARDERFERLCPQDGRRDPHSERAELVLRFFAYSERYRQFHHDVGPFLDAFLLDKNADPDLNVAEYRRAFDAMTAFVDHHLPHGFRKSKGAPDVPRVRFEAISIGVHLALTSGRLNPVPAFDWLESEKFQSLVKTDASNSGPKLRERVEFVRDMLIC